MSEWQEVQLGSICDIYDGPHATPPKQDKGFVFSGISSLGSDGRIDSAHFEYISENYFKKWTKRIEPKYEDIVFSYETKLGVAAIIPKGFKCCLGRRMGLLRPKLGIYPRFLLYAYLAPEFQKTIHERTFHGSTVDRIPLKEMSSFPVTLPPITEQKAIAAVLSSLDDKIDLLHRQNKTLEAMAETLFRQWFTVEAHEDWDEGILDDVISVKGGTTPSTKEPEYWDGEIHWTSPRDLSNHETVYLFDTERKITAKGLEKIGSGLMLNGTVLLSSRAPIGYLAITDIPVAINQGYIAIVCNKMVSNYFMYLWCKLNMEDIKNAGNGSTFEEISKSNFKTLALPIPPKQRLEEFDESISPAFRKIRSNQKQIYILEKLRDTLLPKLMSGEARVMV